MATHKREHFTPTEQRLAAVAKALGHPARVAIVGLLARRQSCVCGELVLELPLSQSTVSQHLKELKAAGLVQGEIDGPRVCYCLDPAGWAVARQLLGDLLAAMPTAAPAAPAAASCC
jgi:DNA-binding transcriptional ArsR family regulator